MMIKKNVFIMIFVFFVSHAFSQRAIFKYENQDLRGKRITGIIGGINEPYCLIYIQDSVFANKLIDKINKLIPDTTAKILGEVTKQLVCIKSGYSGYDVLSCYGDALSPSPKMQLNGKPMKLDRKLLNLLDEIVKIHKKFGGVRVCELPEEIIEELYMKEFWGKVW